eukprot:SAG22_NODE_9170_length_605_cov_1.857708_1_plen_66_part_10
MSTEIIWFHPWSCQGQHNTMIFLCDAIVEKGSFFSQLTSKFFTFLKPVGKRTPAAPSSARARSNQV